MLQLGDLRQASQVTDASARDLIQVSQVTDASAWGLETGLTG